MRVGYFYMDDVLTPDQCEQIIALGREKLEPAKTAGNGVKESVRKGGTSFFSKGEHPEIDDLLQKCVNAMTFCGQQAFGFTMAQTEPIQFTDYGVGDFYEWHYDQNGIMAEEPDRHLSASIELCDPDTYEGGGLEFFAIDDGVPERKQGRIIVFSSMMCHRARRIEAGRRSSLVIWGRV